MKEGKHIIFLDYVRIVACLMVMLVHSSENFYGADPTVGMAGNVSMLANESNRFWVAFYDGGVSRTAVPLFFIVSAFLLVPMKPHIATVLHLPPALFIAAAVVGRNDMAAVADGPQHPSL